MSGEVKPEVKDARAEQANKSSGPSRGWMAFVLIFGVALPLITLIVELTLRICSSCFFDPIPSAAHLVLLSITPIASLAVLLIHRAAKPRYSAPAAFLVGISMGVSIIYSLQFLPLSPFSLIGILCVGIGLCGLSPFFALWATIVCNKRLRSLPMVDRRRHGKLLWAGALISSVVLLVSIGSTLATSIGMRQAASANPEESMRGVRLIRAFGSERVLLRACYELPTGVWSDPFSLTSGLSPTSREESRTTYYKVTGRPFNSVPPPKLVGFRSERTSDFSFDADVGGTAVNSQVVGLSMITSRMDGVVYPDALTAYTEWTMVFSNNTTTAREARAEIALPPGGVVSRLTLWVNGEEREAAFAGRGQVREAYQEVAVVQRHDPVLVTTCGPDRILVQCFPVPADGGTMKIRIGVTSPLIPEDYTKGTYILPHFVERNFTIPDGIKHSLLVESSDEMSLGSEHARRIRADIEDADLIGAKGTITCSRQPEVRLAWTPDASDPKRYAIAQTLAESKAKSPENIIIVVDGSRRMASVRGDIADALANLPDKSSFSVIAAQNDVARLASSQQVTPENVESIQDKIRGMKCVGGIDNRPALMEACDEAIQHPNSVIVWIHGPQPLPSNALTEQFLQLSERTPGTIRIYSVAASDGRNSILTDLERTGMVTPVPRIGTLTDDLKKLFAGMGQNAPRLLVIKRERVPLQSVMSGIRATAHIGRLWAEDQVLRICRSGDSRTVPEAVRLAAQHHIVTPVSGAVVLENAAQYKQTGLRPVDPADAPSVVPEPAGWMALAAGMAVLVVYSRRRGGVQSPVRDRV